MISAVAVVPANRVKPNDPVKNKKPSPSVVKGLKDIKATCKAPADALGPLDVDEIRKLWQEDDVKVCLLHGCIFRMLSKPFSP